MSGLGFNPAYKAATMPPKRAMGIQFVKSADTVGRQQNTGQSTLNHDQGRNSPGVATTTTNTLSKTIPPLLSCQFNMPPHGQTKGAVDTSRFSPHTYGGQTFVKSGETYSSIKKSFGSGLGYKMPGQTNLNKGVDKAGGVSSSSFQPVADAKPVCTKDEYLKAWKAEKDPDLSKLRKLAHEVVSLKSARPNAKDKLHSAANRVPLRVEFNTEPVFGAKGNNSFMCFVFIESVSIASGRGSKIKDAKTYAYEAALQKILMPHLRIVPIDPTSKELQASKEPFTSPPRAPSKFPINKVNNSIGNKDALSTNEVASQHKESNLEAAGLKRRHNEYKHLDEFVVVEPKIPIPDCTASHTLRRSADFNHMLLEYEYFFKGEAARCILRIENEILADVNGSSKATAKNTASLQALQKLKKFCWIIKTKQAVDSNTKISKDEMLNELNEQSDSISQDNIGNKLLRKMGWAGGGVGKDGSGIAEPVSLKSVLNREGLGLSATKGVTDEFRKRVKDVIEGYAASDNQEDLVFSSDFRLEERQIIHDECRRLNLRSKSKGKGQKRYLCVRRKRSVNQLFDHLMSVGGETARYQLVPPGQDPDGNSYSFNPQNGHGSQSLNCETSSSNSNLPNSVNTSSHFNNAAPTPHMSLNQTGGQQIGWAPNPRDSTRYNGGNEYDFGGSRQGLLGNHPPQPHQNQNHFSGNFAQGGGFNNGQNIQPSTFTRSTGHGPTPTVNSSLRMGYNNSQRNTNNPIITNNPQNSPQNSDTYSTRGKSSFRPSGNDSPQGGSANKQTLWSNGGFQQGSVNSYGGNFNSGMYPNQPHNNNNGMAAPRTGFNSGVAGNTTSQFQSQVDPFRSQSLQTGAGQDWSGPTGQGHGNGSKQWGTGAYPNPQPNMQQQQQQQRVNYSDFNSSTMGGGYNR